MPRFSRRLLCRPDPAWGDRTVASRARSSCQQSTTIYLMDHTKLWEEHTAHEFATRDTEATLATMVEDAYVNHIPTLTGGAGKPALRAFYSTDFIPCMPPDTTLTPISRTVGTDQLVDEMIFEFTH